ncbi:MAG TPA: hypothetical protein VJ904_03955, partial [Tichowtungia sp.]|nr:hypothetical protein [Tichowtungia sp.]
WSRGRKPVHRYAVDFPETRNPESGLSIPSSESRAGNSRESMRNVCFRSGSHIQTVKIFHKSERVHAIRQPRRSDFNQNSSAVLPGQEITTERCVDRPQQGRHRHLRN